MKKWFIWAYCFRGVGAHHGSRNSWELTFQVANGKQREHTGNGAGIWSLKRSLSGILPLMKPHPKPSQTVPSTRDQVFKSLSPMEAFSFRLHTLPSFLELLLPKLTAELGGKEPHTLFFPLPFPSLPLSSVFSALLLLCIFILFSRVWYTFPGCGTKKAFSECIWTVLSAVRCGIQRDSSV